MSSYDKIVKLACKPKAAPPKAKYLDPIIAATWDDGGAVHDVCKALSPRLREPNAIIVFKALIVLHTMIRSGSTDNVLGYLSGSTVLRLSNVSTGTWEGYTAPENLQHYSAYLDSRIRSYRDLKHDAIRVQSDTNRDARTNAAVAGTTLQRSKTLAGRKLRSMTVEKGLLRETRIVHRMIDALVCCRFYLDDLEDPLTLAALRMLVKDLLILFQAGNEGVINLLENYFEMSQVDAKDALDIYRHFCKQTEQVVEYLGVARKLQNLLNVPIPNLKHAPVSLAGALQEYLDDPAFEQNRIEYKMNKEAVKRGGRGNAKETTAVPPVPALPASVAASSSSPSNGTANGTTPKNELVDFFSSIEETQSTMFNPSTNSPNSAYFQQMATSPNPFQRMQALPTGPFAPQPTGAFLGPQPTAGPFGPGPQLQLPQATGVFPGGLQPQATGFNPFIGAPRPVSAFESIGAQPTGAFGMSPQPMGMAPSPMGMAPSPMGIAPQATGAFAGGLQQQQQQQQQPVGAPSFLRPQMTGGGAANPFRASQAIPPLPGTPSLSAGPTMGGPSFGGGGGLGVGLRPQMTGGANPFRASMMMSQGTGPAGVSVPVIPPFVIPDASSSPVTSGTASGLGMGIARPASAPLSALSPAPNATLQPVKTHQTGTRNPFGQPAPKQEVPALPTRQPTMFEIMGQQQQQTQAQMQAQVQAQQVQMQEAMKPQPTGFLGSTAKAFDYSSSALGPGNTDISSVASEFAFNKSSSIPGTSDASSSLLSNPSFTGSTTTSFSQPLGSNSGSFSPTSSTFSSSGSSFNPASSAPPAIAAPILSAQPTGGLKAFKPSSSFGASLLEALPSIPGSAPATPAAAIPMQPQTGFFATQPTGFSGNGGLGVGLRPQMTGGAANPFRASMAAPGSGSIPPLPTGAGAFGGSTFGAFGTQQSGQQNGTASLI